MVGVNVRVAMDAAIHREHAMGAAMTMLLGSV
jgi:hypothetical protein